MNFENEEVFFPEEVETQSSQPQEEDFNFEENQPVNEEVDTLEPELTDELEEDQPTEEQLEEDRQAFLKVKYNSEEMDLDEDTARELAQKGMNYDKVLDRLNQFESDPRLTLVEELAQEQNMSPEEFVQAVRESREQRQLDELIQQNIPEDYAREMLENRKFREKLQAEEQSAKEEQARNAEFGEFFDIFKEETGRDYDPRNDSLPDEVWEAHQQGEPLKYAYLRHHSKQLKSQLKQLKQNQTNSKRAPISSVTSHGSTEVASEDDFIRGFDMI